jgi:CspA family cold shock protein
VTARHGWPEVAFAFPRPLPYIHLDPDFAAALFAAPSGGYSLQANAEFGYGTGEWSPARSQREFRVSKEPVMATGTVKFFNTQKGFGFIAPVDGGNDVFVHISALERAGIRSLNEGDKVTYDVVSERGKLAASNLAKA